MDNVLIKGGTSGIGYIAILLQMSFPARFRPCMVLLPQRHEKKGHCSRRSHG